MKKIAINGLGRIGRMVLRHYMNNPVKDIEIVAANDLVPPENLAYLLHFDSVHRRTPYPVAAKGDTITMGDFSIKMFAEKDPASLPWREMGVDLVIESTGFFTQREKAAGHLRAGAKQVLISAPSQTADLTVVLGVNEAQFDLQKHQVISMASCTTNSLAPALKVLNDAFGIEDAMITTVHAYTATQAVVDRPSKKLRRGRTAAVSLIPTTTGAAVATTLVLPELKGKMDAIAIRAPIPDGAVTDIVAHLQKDVTVDSVNAALQKAAEGPMNGILGYSEEELVSADIIDEVHSGIIDALSTRVVGNRLIKVLVWYDNEYGYSKRLLDFIEYIAKRESSE
ncbi:glyceraldehyde-3-phosphate dehydrogenase [bacterium BMS3Abin05]|nr:glyceraldehyde-3-phosphate dehydrogenase [bacterium BMS3Abin05]GBE28029.1 glyceraldehyde-3-phosphate dehydrogenase [bacterium BMS3Bbin03]HDZ13149.1 type I glyceraldehyde-3-phosphate dehydrogenase [Bacteroidota bacterium]